MERVIAYIDGYNLYYGLREKGWKHLYWLNIKLLVENLMRPGQALIVTKYFTTIVREPGGRHQRQAVFLEALQTLTDFQVFYGHFLSDTIACRHCGYTYQTHHEKMTDVNISVQMMTDVYCDRFDTALLMSGDSDLLGSVRAVRELFSAKRVVVAFPPARSSKALQKATNAYFTVGRRELAKSLFPDPVVKADGHVLHRPTEWH